MAARDAIPASRMDPAPSPLNGLVVALAESEPFRIDNSAPEIAGMTAAREGSRLRVRFKASDAWSLLDRSEYSVDGGEWKVMLPVSRLFDSRQLDFDFVTDEAGPGEHTIAVRVWLPHDEPR